MEKRGAIELALDLYRHPTKVKAVRKAALPIDVLKLVRIVAGSDDEISALNLTDLKSPTEMRDAAVFFIQQIMFQPNSAPHRVLGLGENASLQEIKDHKRLLLKWLHPDRNQNTWERVYFQRVIHAAASVEGVQTNAVVPVGPRPQRMPHHTSKTVKPKLQLKPIHRAQSWQAKLRQIFRRLLLFTATFFIAVTTFSVFRRLGYVSDDLPVFEQLQAWLR